MNLIEKRRGTLINVAYFAVLAVGYYLFMKYALGLVAPFVFTFLIALMLQKPIRKISEKTKIKKKTVSIIVATLVLFLLLGIVALVGYRLVAEFKDFIQFLSQKLSDLPQVIESVRLWVLDVIEILPAKAEASATEAVNGFFAGLIERTEEQGVAGLGGEEGLAGLASKLDLSLFKGPLDGVVEVAKKIPWILTAMLISTVSFFFITTDYDNIVAMIKRNVSASSEFALVKAKNIFTNVIGKMVKSYTTIILITFSEVAVALTLMQLMGVYKGSHIVVIAIITALVDIIPVLGTGTVVIPWAIYSLIMGDIPFAIGLVILYIVVTVIRQIIEPKLVAMNVGVHPILTLSGMYLGAQLFGAIGLFAVPITLVLLKALNKEGIIHLWGRKKDKTKATENVDVEKNVQNQDGEKSVEAHSEG